MKNKYNFEKIGIKILKYILYLIYLLCILVAGLFFIGIKFVIAQPLEIDPINMSDLTTHDIMGDACFISKGNQYTIDWDCMEKKGYDKINSHIYNISVIFLCIILVYKLIVYSAYRRYETLKQQGVQELTRELDLKIYVIEGIPLNEMALTRMILDIEQSREFELLLLYIIPFFIIGFRWFG